MKQIKTAEQIKAIAKECAEANNFPKGVMTDTFVEGYFIGYEHAQQLKPEWTAVEDGLPEIVGQYLAVLEYIIQGITYYKIDITEYVGGEVLWQQHAFNKEMPHN